MKEGKSVKLNHQQQHQNGHHSPSKFSKLFDPEASWDKDQLGDVLHWIRQVLGLVCGLIWGAIPFVGGIWFILFLVMSSAIIYGYYALVLKVDEEEFGGHGALLQEGLFASITLFLVIYCVCHCSVNCRKMRLKKKNRGLLQFYNLTAFHICAAFLDFSLQFSTLLIG